MRETILLEWTDPSHTSITALGRELQLKRYQFANKYISDGDVVFDLGCGSGYGTKIFATKAHKVVGVDISNVAINYAKTHHSGPNIDYVVADLDYPLGLDGKVNVLVALEIIEHIRDPQTFLEHCYKLLVGEGVLVLSTPLGNSQVVPKNPYHRKEFSRKELTNLLENANYNLIEVVGQAPILGAILRYLTQRGFLKPGVGIHHKRIKKVTDKLPYFSGVFSEPTTFLIDTSRHMLVAAKK